MTRLVWPSKCQHLVEKDQIDKIFSFYFTGLLPINRVVTPVHDWINSANHMVYLGYHFNLRLMLPNNEIPPKGQGTVKTNGTKRCDCKVN